MRTEYRRDQIEHRLTSLEHEADDLIEHLAAATFAFAVSALNLACVGIESW